MISSQTVTSCSDALAGRRILITAGPTWVRIDPVRHIGNFSSGKTGLAIAAAAAEHGAEVTLLLGPVQVTPGISLAERVRIVPYVTFDDLHALVRRELAAGDYDAMIHAAAVSDYRPVSEATTKLPSGEEELVLRLQPTPKIVDEVKALSPDTLLVKFKLEVSRSVEELHAIARASAARSRAELVVANDLSEYRGEQHVAYLLDQQQVLARTETTAELAQALVGILGPRLTER